MKFGDLLENTINESTKVASDIIDVPANGRFPATPIRRLLTNANMKQGVIFTCNGEEMPFIAKFDYLAGMDMTEKKAEKAKIAEMSEAEKKSYLAKKEEESFAKKRKTLVNNMKNAWVAAGKAKATVEVKPYSKSTKKQEIRD